MRILNVAAAIALVAFCFFISAGCAQTKPCETMGRIERLDPALDQLVPRDAKIEKLAEGFKWAEGPAWVGGKHSFLVFSDVIANTAYRWANDTAHPYISPSGFLGTPGTFKGKEPGSNGISVDPRGRLTLCQHGERRVVRVTGMYMTEARFEVLADRYEGKRLNSPNDLCFDAAGNLYFTDPPYGLSTQDEKAPEKELDFQGVYRVDAATGKLTLLTKEFSRPNGIALSPDDKTLYVAQSDGKKPIIMAFDVTADGIANGRLFFDAKPLQGSGPGGPDGMKTDAAGNVFAAGPGGIMVLSKEGKHLGTIRPSEDHPTANCCFGGTDGTWLYMTNDHTLCRIKLNTKGKGF
jgi:gluconolactonase